MNDTMNTNKTLIANYPSVIITFADTQIEVWYRKTLSNSVVLMEMKPVDENISEEDWDWICSDNSHFEQIEKIVANEINN